MAHSTADGANTPQEQTQEAQEGQQQGAAPPALVSARDWLRQAVRERPAQEAKQIRRLNPLPAWWGRFYIVLDDAGQIAAAVCLSGACRTDHTPVALAAQVGAGTSAPLAA